MKRFYIVLVLCLFYLARLAAQPCTAVNATNTKLDVTPSQSFYCVGAKPSFSINTSFPLQVGTMQWSYSGTASSIVTGTNKYTLNGVLTGGIVTVNFTVAVGGTTCAVTRTFAVNVFPITVNAGLDQIITGATPVITLGGSPTASGGAPSLSYLWSPGGYTTANPTVSPVVNTDYTLTVTDANGCTKQDFVSVIVTFSYGHLKRSLDASYYQVTNGKLYFAFTEEYKDATALKYRIYNDARSIRADNTVPPAPALTKYRGDNRFLLDLSSVSLGFTVADNTNFFTLQVTNDKNEVFLLKFRYAQ